MLFFDPSAAERYLQVGLHLQSIDIVAIRNAICSSLFTPIAGVYQILQFAHTNSEWENEKEHLVLSATALWLRQEQKLWPVLRRMCVAHSRFMLDTTHRFAVNVLIA